MTEHWQQTWLNRWVINATEAREHLAQGATVLDTRPLACWLLGHVPKAVPVNWRQFSRPQLPDRGKLIEDNTGLEQKLQAVGVCNTRPVIVVGGPQAPWHFGEEGRMVWMLRLLGHPAAAFVDGGQRALVQAGVPLVIESVPPSMRGDFVVRRCDRWTIQREELRTQLASPENTARLVILDTREPREYAGATPYGEQRGGHIPGAVSFYFKALLHSSGQLLPREQLLARFSTLGIARDTPVVAYCTGGVRSAFFVAVLVSLGFCNVKNYAGSMWDWSAADPDCYLLVVNA